MGKSYKSFDVCAKCGYYHTTKTCPVITGKQETRWKIWARQYQVRGSVKHKN